MEEKGAALEQILPLISGDKVREAYETGETTNAMITAGQSVGLIHNIPSVKEIIDGIISQAETIVNRLERMEKG
jgi:NAD(P)H-dependent flavin oxidoreductase YrpB (nitropropane dioxygenase family)